MESTTMIAVLSVVGLLLLVILLGAIWAGRYKKVGPHEALIISGRGGTRVIIGGATFVMPVLYRVFVMDLRAQTVPVEQSGIYTKLRVPINVKAILVYKVKGDVESIKLAAQALLNKGQQAIESLVQSVAEAAFRDIGGKMTPEDINEDREAFQNKVTEVARGHFEKLGIELTTFSVKHISDDGAYFVNLGAPRQSEVSKDARVKKAEFDRAAVVVEAEQELGSKKRQAETQAEILLAQKDRNVKEQQYKAETATETAKAAQAGPKAEAVATQDVVTEQTKLAVKQAELKGQQLLASIVRPAEADRDAVIAKAEGEKKKVILAAEGDAEKLKLIGTAEGEAAQKKGEGEAAGIKAKLIAEADGLSAKAKAMKEFSDATMKLEIAKTLIATLPQIITAAATPISGVDSIKVIDFGGGGSATGQESGGPLGRLLNISPKTLAVVDETLKATLGMSLKDAIQLVRKGDITEIPPAKEESPSAEAPVKDAGEGKTS